MKDPEKVKAALRCVAEGTWCETGKCEYWDARRFDGCYKEIAKDALELLEYYEIHVDAFLKDAEKGKHEKRVNSRYKPGYWNGLQGGEHYGQYFDMEDVNRVGEMLQVASALDSHGVPYCLTKLKTNYRITVSKKDYFRMSEALREKIAEINSYHERINSMIAKHDMKPCPFCGCIDLYQFIYPFKRKPGIRGCYVKCQNCGAATGNFETIEDARAAWNERKSETQDVLRMG